MTAINMSKIPGPSEESQKFPDRQPRDPKGKWTPPTTNRVSVPEFDYKAMAARKKGKHGPADPRVFLDSHTKLDPSLARLKAEDAKKKAEKKK
jgi:hypothetical protein